MVLGFHIIQSRDAEEDQKQHFRQENGGGVLAVASNSIFDIIHTILFFLLWVHNSQEEQKNKQQTKNISIERQDTPSCLFPTFCRDLSFSRTSFLE